MASTKVAPQSVLSTTWQKGSHYIPRAAVYVTLAIGAVVFAFPFLWLVSTSLKPSNEVFLFPPTLIPSTIEWSNYPLALSRFRLLESLTNTITILALVEVGRLISVPLAAYAFASLRFPFRGPLFILVLATMMLPYQVLIIPQFLLFRNLEWLNTYLPLTVPAFLANGGLGAFTVFLLRQFFLTIPREYAEAAEIDGCGFFRIFWHIILPLSKPGLAVIGIFTFLDVWNDFFGPLIYLTDQSKYTLALNFQLFSQREQVSLIAQPFNLVMVIATIITIVPIVVFFVTQRYFIRGVVISGVKG